MPASKAWEWFRQQMAELRQQKAAKARGKLQKFQCTHLRRGLLRCSRCRGLKLALMRTCLAQEVVGSGLKGGDIKHVLRPLPSRGIRPEMLQQLRIGVYCPILCACGTTQLSLGCGGAGVRGARLNEDVDDER